MPPPRRRAAAAFLIAMAMVAPLLCRPAAGSTPAGPAYPRPADTLDGYLRGLGYTVESHWVTTTDGYILNLFRLPQDKGKQAAPVFLQHGLLASAWCWVINAPGGMSPALQLWQQGYDVWLGNSRGNAFSKNHTTLNPTLSRAFWNYTFDEMGRYDVPANVEYVLGATGAESLSWVGWSQGTTQMFVAAQNGDEGAMLAKRINVAAFLSPAAYMSHVSRNVLIGIVSKLNLGQVLLKLFPYDFLGSSKAIHKAEETLCKLTLGAVCKLGVDVLAGTSKMDDKQAIEGLAAHFPAGSSVKSLVHYEQLIDDPDDKNFRQWDFGKKGNEAAYNQDSPPEYDLSKVAVPVALFVGSHDDLSDPVDALATEQALIAGGHAPVFSKTYQDFSHVTWLVGTGDAYKAWFADLTDLLAKYAGR